MRSATHETRLLRSSNGWFFASRTIDTAACRETEAFGPLLLRIRAELDATLLVIEHDMPLIFSISDNVYCLEAGKVIASGTPAEVRDNQLVIASYLGTDERAIRRSDIKTGDQP